MNSLPYGIGLDIIKSPSTSSILSSSSHSSSPSSTLSESSNSALAISTRKPRTPRKRLNQTYNEAAVLLSTAYPNIFSPKQIIKPCKFINSSFSFEDELLLLPFPVEKPSLQIDPIAYKKPSSNFETISSDLCDGFDEDFDAKSILDEEIEEGVMEGIMGNLSGCAVEKPGLGLGLGLGLELRLGIGMKRGALAKAFRQHDEGDWWRFPIIDVGEISTEEKKVEKLNPTKENSDPIQKSTLALSKGNSTPNPNSSSTSRKEISFPIPKSIPGMLLKLNYDEVLNAWSNRGSLFTDDFPGSDSFGSDALAKLEQIDLFGENGALRAREASLQRYKEKKRTRLLSKKIRYQVRKANYDERPRMKGRFVRKPNSCGS